LANNLIAAGHQVYVLDDLSNGRRELLEPSVQFTQGDIDNIPLLWSLLYDVDCVYHLAARVSVAQSILHPREYNRVNVGGTVSLMEAMRDTGVRRVVFASSGAIYGHHSQSRNGGSADPHSQPTRQPYGEPVGEHVTPQPDSPYAVSKWAAERYIHTIGELWGIETVALRIFNAYGPNQSLPLSHAPVVPRFLQQALTGGSVVLFGDGRQTRDFVYVDDVVDALITAATAVGINRKDINIGSGVEVSIDELVDEVELVVGRRVNRIYNAGKPGGVERLVADISCAEQLLGFRPRTDLSRGLRQTVENDLRFRRYAGERAT
jgi:UDP-glucose 4-epimerase